MITNKDIEEMKKTFATKRDLQAFATKRDLQAFATKKDLKAFATKKDLQSMENRIVKKIDEVVSFFDDSIIDHEKRIKILESQNAAVL